MNNHPSNRSIYTVSNPSLWAHRSWPRKQNRSNFGIDTKSCDSVRTHVLHTFKLKVHISKHPLSESTSKHSLLHVLFSNRPSTQTKPSVTNLCQATYQPVSHESLEVA